MRILLSLSLLTALCYMGCKKPESNEAPATPTAPAAKTTTIGLVTDIGGRGDQSFNDSALRGLELWSGGAAFKSGAYQPVPAAEIEASVPVSLKGKVHALGIKPMVVQSKAQEDYQPNLQLLVDQGADLTVGTGFMLENAVEAVAKANPKAKFLLIDSPLLDAKGAPITLPNVRTVVFREEEGSFLVGALAGSVAKKQVGFVGGMEIPLIKKFEAGFRAGVRKANPDVKVLIAYTGSFDNVAAGKQVAQDLFAKGCERVFHAAGSDGLGVIQAAKEARAAGKAVYVIGVDSDQHHLAPEAVLSSMVKQVDWAVYQTVELFHQNRFAQGDIALGLKEGGVNYAPIRVAIPEKEKVIAQLESLRAKVVSGEIKVPSNLAEL